MNTGTQSKYWYCTGFCLCSWCLLNNECSNTVLLKFLTLHGTQSFLSMFINIFHQSLSHARQIKLTPFHLISLRSIIKLSPHICLGLHSSIFPSGLSKKTQCKCFLFHACCMAHPSHPLWFAHAHYNYNFNDTNESWNHNLNEHNSRFPQLLLLV